MISVIEKLSFSIPESATASPKSSCGPLSFSGTKTPFLFLFLLEWAQGCRAKVRYRSSNTPAQLSFAPEDSQIHEPWCRCSSLLHAGVKIFSLSGCLSILSSSTHGRLHETQWQNHYLLPTYHILFG